MLVRELIEILKSADLNVQVSVAYGTYVYTGDHVRVGELCAYDGKSIVIGSFDHLDLNGRNHHVVRTIDGKRELPQGSSEGVTVSMGRIIPVRGPDPCSRCGRERTQP